MPYTNKLLNVGDLLAAWQNRGMREQADGSNYMNEKKRKGDMYEQAAMQQLAQSGTPVTTENVQKLQAGLWQPGESTVVPDKTQGMLTGEFANFLGQRQKISDMPGYVTGTNPAQYESEQAALRNTLAGTRWGGAGNVIQGDRKPTGPELNEALANPNYQGGYAKGGPGMAGLLAEQKMQSDVDEAEKGRANQLNIAREYANARVESSGGKGGGAAKSAALERVAEFQQTEDFASLPEATRVAALSDPEIVKMFGDKNVDYMDVLIAIAMKYPSTGALPQEMTATNKKTGKTFAGTATPVY